MYKPPFYSVLRYYYCLSGNFLLSQCYHQPCKYRYVCPIGTSEYQTIKRCTPQLITAVQDNLTMLGGHLLSKGLITADKFCQLRNKNNPKLDRAADLVSLVLSKVELNSGSYCTFIECLEENRENNRQILEILNGVYASGKYEFHYIMKGLLQ